MAQIEDVELGRQDSRGWYQRIVLLEIRPQAPEVAAVIPGEHEPGTGGLPGLHIKAENELCAHVVHAALDVLNRPDVGSQGAVSVEPQLGIVLPPDNQREIIGTGSRGLNRLSQLHRRERTALLHRVKLPERRAAST